MPRYEQQFSEIRSLAESKKITDRKKCITKLKELYDSAEAVEELHSNSRQRKGAGTSWTGIVDSLHILLLSEVNEKRSSASTSKSSRAKDTESINRTNYSMTMLETIKKGNSSEIVLKCNDLVALVLQILPCPKYIDYHKAYLAILLNHVLAVKKYQFEMSYDQWKELLDTCKAMYENVHPCPYKSMILEAMCQIVKHGCIQSHLALHVKGIFPFLVKVLEEAKTDSRNLADDTFKLVNAVCEAVGPESRVALCEFGETVLGSAIRLNGSGVKYDWILLIVRAHHPGGATQKDDAAYACNWENWNDILRLIYVTILNECKSEFVSNSFVQLACEVSWQLKDDLTCIDDEMRCLDESSYGQPSKRSRTVIGIQGMIDSLTAAPHKEYKTSIQILIALMTQYPKSIKDSNFLPLMEYLIHYLNTCKDQDIMDQLWEFAQVMIQLEGSLSTNLSENNGIKSTWEKVWSITLRSVSANKNEDQVHRLLQSLISHKKVIDANAFLNLYLKDTVKWSKPSVRTLLAFCKRNIIQDFMGPTSDESVFASNNRMPVKLQLLQWVLAVPQDEWNARFPIEDVSELLVGLTLKSWSTIDQSKVPNVAHQSKLKKIDSESEAQDSLSYQKPRCGVSSMEHTHLLTAIESDLLKETDTKKEISWSRTPRDNVLYTKDNRDLLIKDLIEKTVEMSKSKTIHFLIVQTAVIAKVFSNFEKLNIASEKIRESLGTVIKSSLEEISLAIDEMVKPKKKLKRNLTNVLQALCLFYKTPYENDVADIIRSSTEVEMLRNIFLLTDVDRLCETDGESEMEDGNMSIAYIKDITDWSERHRLFKSNDSTQKTDSLSDQNNIRMKACTILATFCGMANCSVMSRVQENLQMSLLKPDNYDLDQIFDFRMAVAVLESLTDCGVHTFSGNVFDSSLKLLQHLSRTWHKDAKASSNLLEILSKLFVHLKANGSEIQRQNSLGFLVSFHKLLKQNKYGPMTYITYIKCLETIVKIDPTFSWTLSENGAPVVEDLLEYLQNPFQVVRVKAIKCLHILFASEKVSLTWLRDLFDKVGTVITTNLFVVKGELTAKVKEDERWNRIASALHIMAVVASASAIFRSEALLSIFQLTVDKNVNTITVKKVLERISISLGLTDSNDLIENNLNYLLTHWLEKEYQLQKFPITLVNCESEVQFYHKYMDIVVPVLIQQGNLKEAQDLCKKYGKSFKEAVENCFPRLISWMLPHISANPLLPPKGIGVIDIRRATEVFNQLNLNQNEFQAVQEIPTLVQKNLESVIINIIKHLHDEEHSMRFFTHSTIAVTYPASDPPHFKHQDIKRSFKYLEDNIIGESDSLLRLLAISKRDVLQKVLLNLKCSIHEANSIEHKLKALHHYVYFCSMLLEKIDQDYFDEMSAYVVRDITHTLIYFITSKINSISQAACGYFDNLLKRILPKRHEEIKQNLRLIMTSLIPIVETGRSKHAYNIMKFLIAEQNDVLGEAIERLDSFPVDSVFEEVRDTRSKDNIGSKQSLETEIQHFLHTRDESTEYCSSTELDRLNEQLSTRKTELKEMYQSLGSMHRFSEDCASSKLHRLICVLVKLTTSSVPDIALRAAKCLGELGPADLSTMILQPEKDHSKQLKDPMLLFTYRVLILLSNLLIHSDVQLFTSTSDVLYIVMASYWGQKVSVNKTLNELKSKIQGSEDFLHVEYIRPFVTNVHQRKDTNAIDKTKFHHLMREKRELWTGSLNGSHKDWITNITCNILECFNGSYLKHLIPVCRANVSFCEKILPWIVNLVIQMEKTLSNKICDSINSFFHYHYANSSDYKNNFHQNNLHSHTCFNHESVQCMLNVVDFLRSQCADNCQFELNYLHIAKAAQYCSAYFTSVLYAELWCEKFLSKCSSIDYVLTSIDYICETDSENGRVLQEILREAFIRIGDPDAIYGCGASYFLNPSARIEHHVQLRQWDKVLLAHDIEVSLGNKTATKGLLDALQHSGLQYLLGAFVKTIDKGEEDIDVSYRYECAWRLSDWDLPTTQKMINLQEDNSARLQNIVSNDYSLFHYHALKSFHESDTEGLKSSLDNARLSIINTLRNISLESCKTVYPALSQLQMLREIEELYFAEPETYNQTIEKWNNQDSIGVDDFEYIEPILSQRTILLQAKDADDSQVIQDALVDTYLQVTELSEKYGYFQMAARALATLAKQGQLSAETTYVLQYQEAMLAWMRGDQDLGRHLLRNLLAKDSLSPSINAQALKVYGNWMAETKSENPQKVIEAYYSKSLKCSERISNPTPKDKKNKLDTHAALAQFADAQYQQIMTYVKSPQFESFKECVAYSEETAEKLSTVDGDEKRAAYINKKQSSNDMVELENIEREKNTYLLLALEHYIHTLQQGEDHNLLVFRLVSLWLDNMQHIELSELLQAQLHKLPSYKFVMLVPQLAAHMTDTNDMFSTQIYNLLRRCAIEHPHHTLPVLLSLMNLHKDYEFIKSKKKQSNKPEPRVLGAKKLIEHLMSTKIDPIIQEMCRLAHSLIMLANFETPQGVAQKNSVPKNSQSIVQIQNLEHTLVPTLSIDVRPDKVYNRIITVQRYDNNFELVGGINAPKKITCYGSDGKQRNQLVKGKDDLRQDAVMQQVFTVMNMLLRTSKEANKRKLNVRTYKVVPLTQRCGILEWCDNTVPIGLILEGSIKSPGLHEKYYPTDYPVKRCRNNLHAVSKKSNTEKLRVFMDCCKHLHPALHYFFLETFSSPEIWFERRLAYVHSVATTSIIGYILGLGDRHVNNILVDKSTAEVIHIDFGIAFEQGKVLPTPETVPFRLTRDIEAAMGVSGVEGVLRRSCEETMTVLRYHREVILTLLQVLLYDPLFSWAITPAKAYSMQKGSLQGSSEGQKASGETNKLAERALLRLDQKLRGTEEGSASSVAGQVEKLIQEARDPVNLCRLFVGWQPYL